MKPLLLAAATVALAAVAGAASAGSMSYSSKDMHAALIDCKQDLRHYGKARLVHGYAGDGSWTLRMDDWGEIGAAEAAEINACADARVTAKSRLHYWNTLPRKYAGGVGGQILVPCYAILTRGNLYCVDRHE